MLISKFNNNNIVYNIEYIEEKYDLRFPEVYKVFLYRYNGGKTPETSFKLNKVSSEISGFYGFGCVEKFYNFSLVEKSNHFDDWIDEKMLPIGFNDTGDYILISCGEIDNGKIYFFYHDRPKKYIEISNTLNEFVNKCKSKEIGHIRTIEERRQGMIDKGYGDKITPEKLAGWQAEIDEYYNIIQEKLVL